MAGLANGTMKLVIVQFLLNSVKSFPKEIVELFNAFGNDRETVNELITRRRAVSGQKFLESTPHVAIDLAKSLMQADYKLVWLFCQIRGNAVGKTHLMVRFTFATEDTNDSAGEFCKRKEEVARAFSYLCSQFMWSVEGYVNPYFVDNDIVDNNFAVSLNAASRSSLFDNNGKPSPVQPKGFLRIQNDDICVVGE